MIFDTYLIAILSGLVLYLVMILDAKYIDTSKGDEPISPKIPLFVTLMVWIICTFRDSPSIQPMPMNKQYASVLAQRLMQEPF